jgi:Ribosomal protein S19
VGHKLGEFSPTRTFHGHTCEKKVVAAGPIAPGVTAPGAAPAAAAPAAAPAPAAPRK